MLPPIRQLNSCEVRTAKFRHCSASRALLRGTEFSVHTEQPLWISFVAHPSCKLVNLNLQSRSVGFGSSQWRWRRNVWKENDVKLMSKRQTTPWRHSRESYYPPTCSPCKTTLSRTSHSCENACRVCKNVFSLSKDAAKGFNDTAM